MFLLLITMTIKSGYIFVNISLLLSAYKVKTDLKSLITFFYVLKLIGLPLKGKVSNHKSDNAQLSLHFYFNFGPQK